MCGSGGVHGELAGALGGQKRALDSLELESQAFVGCLTQRQLDSGPLQGQYSLLPAGPSIQPQDKHGSLGYYLKKKKTEEPAGSEHLAY